MRRRKFIKLASMAASLPVAVPILKGTPNQESVGSLANRIAQSARELNDADDSRLVVLYPEGSLSNIEPVATAFERATNVSIDFLVAGVDTINSNLLLNAALGDYQFDIAIPATFGIPDLVEAGALADLTSLRSKYEHLHENMESLYTTGDYYKERFYGYQTDGDAYLMFYNKPWIDDEDEAKRFADLYGYPLAVPETWEELDAMMAFFHRPNEDRFGGCLFRTTDYIVWEWWVRLHAKGKYPVSDDMSPNFDGEEGVAALEALIKATEFQHPSVRTNGLFENWEVFGQGNCFANIGWGGTQKYLRSKDSKMRSSLAFGMTPGGEIDDKRFQTPYFNWGWNYVVSEFSPRKELAHLFTLFASTSEMSSLAVRQVDGYFDPYRSSHYGDESIVQTYGKPFLEIHRKSMSQCIPDFYLSRYIDYFGALKENLMLALNGDLSPEKALDIAAKQWESITDKSGRENQIQQWKFLKSLYPKRAAECLS